MPDRRLSRDEIGERGAAIYTSKLHSILEPKFRGHFVAIDDETEDYEVADEADAASDPKTKERSHHELAAHCVCPAS